MSLGADEAWVNHQWGVEGSSLLSSKFSIFKFLLKSLNASTETKSSGMTSYLIYPTPGMEATQTLLSSTSMSL